MLVAAQAASFLALVALLEPRRASLLGARVEKLLERHGAEQVREVVKWGALDELLSQR